MNDESILLDGIKYCVNGKPIPLKRHRYGKGKTYDSQVQEKMYFSYDVKGQRALSSENGFPPLLECPIIMWIDFYMPIPKSKAKKVFPFDAHFIRPDLSNLIKFVEDVCTGIIYKDDSLIVELHATKSYGDYPRTEFYFMKKGE